MLKEIADELEELNGHILAYLETMALSLLGDCGGDPTQMEASKKARETAATKLLGHVEEARRS
jgi:hypothetical protein